MYVQGISTRKVTTVLQELCGLEVSSTQVSRAAALLDDDLKAWRERSLGKITHVVFDARYEKVRRNGVVVDAAVGTAIAVDRGMHASAPWSLTTQPTIRHRGSRGFGGRQ